MSSHPAAQQGGNFLCCIGIMKFHWCHAVKPLLVSAIVVEFDIVLYCPDQFIPVCKSAQIVHLGFQHSPEALHRSVINATTNSGHTLPHLCCLEFVIESSAGILEPSVAMEQRMRFWMKRYCIIEVIKDELVVVAVANLVCYDSFVIQIKNGTQIQFPNL